SSAAADIRPSMQTEFPVDGLQLRWLDESRVRDHHRMKRPLKRLDPKGQETLQFGEFRKQVVVLPDVGLKKPSMVGTAVENLCRRQTIAAHLPLKVLGCRLPRRCPAGRHISPSALRSAPIQCDRG